MPTLTVVAGPNGSGKSTLTSSIWFGGNENLVDPDAIARGLNSAVPAQAAIPAARETILRCRHYLAKRESFALETTLAGNGAMGILQRATIAGYLTNLVYVSLGNPELHIERVRFRVSVGGHDIADAEIRRRYWRSLARAPEALRLVDSATVLDNSGFRPLLMLLFERGQLMWRAEVLPEWVLGLAGRP